MSTWLPLVLQPLARVSPLWRRPRGWLRWLNPARYPWPRQISVFEKVIVANSAIIILDTGAGWWITQHGPETYHYLIDTTFIAIAVLLGLAINFALLRAAFAPLRAVLATIRAVEHGELEARVVAQAHDADSVALARAFNAMLDRLAQLRDESAGRVLRAQEEERRRLALELHDQTGQSLTALTLHAEAIAQRLAGEHSEAAIQARRQVERLGSLAQQTLVEVQALSRQLRPPLLDDLGLVAALRWLAADGSQRLGVSILLRAQTAAPAGETPQMMRRAPERLPEDVETALFRIAQEGVTNAVRHGHARRIRLRLSQSATGVTLVVVDNGQGFALTPSPPGHPRQPRWGLGLEGMRDRARLIGGILTIQSRPGRGCVVRAVIPLPVTPALAGGEDPTAAGADGAMSEAQPAARGGLGE